MVVCERTNDVHSTWLRVSTIGELVSQGKESSPSSSRDSMWSIESTIRFAALSSIRFFKSPQHR
jgi:hypothetical protein